MPPSQRITEYVIYHLQPGVNLENTTTGNPNQAMQAFSQLTNTIKAQPGFIQQFWGHEIEHPTLFCWVIDWTSLAALTTFTTSPSHTLFIANMNQIFDLRKDPIILHTTITSPPAATAALRSPITEVAFYHMPARATDATARSALDSSSTTVLREVQTIGRASGAAIGFVLDALPHEVVAPSTAEHGPIALYGVFGYASIDVHMRWRETPEGKRHAQEGGDMWPATVVPGVDPETGYFHVRFHQGT